jgi:GTP pyrophosphokinase
MDYAATLLSKFPGTSPRRSRDIKALTETLESYMPAELIERIMKAYEFGAIAHEGQTRISGEPYISHPVAVAQTLADMHLDSQTIVAAILHDVVEDTDIAIAELEDQFGTEVATLVDAVSKLDQMHFTNRAEAQAESFRKMMLAMIEDIRVILVKLADRMHNMETLGAMPREKQARIARETLEIYAPIANRLGINHMKVALEDLGFRYLYPYRYAVLQRALKKSKGSQRQIVKRISESILKAMEEEGITGEVRGREKHLYSIYKKMAGKKRILNDVVDVYGFRIIVDDVNTCYRVLGIVHGLYKPMPGRFKDYIAIPRVNGYQSLHTTLFGPKGFEEFLESVKVDLFPDKIYVFTPKGDILPMPKGATIVDFAYAVHTDVGNRCVAGKVDRTLVPLRTVLKNSQTVEIVTARGAKPNPNWVSFIATAKARSAIRHYMKNMRATDSVDLGKRLLDRSLKDLGSSLRKIGKVRLREALDELDLADATDLYAQLGLGERLAPLTARFLIGEKGEQTEPKSASLVIAGTEGMVVSYAKCCYPIPGDEVMGYLSAGRGVVIHRNSCGNLINFRKQPEKWLSVGWEEGIDRDFSSQIQVETVNKTGVLAEVAAVIADSQSNIEEVSVNIRHQDTSAMTFLLQVKDRTHLAHIMRNVRKMQNVKSVSRDSA